MRSVYNKYLYNPNLDKDKFSYEELMNKTFVWYPNNNVYNVANFGNPMLETYNAYAYSNWENGIELKVTAILKPKETLNFGSLQSGFYYTSDLTNKILESSKDSDIVNYINNLMSANENATDTITSGKFEYNGMSVSTGIYYNYSYKSSENSDAKTATGYIGSQNMMASIMGNMGMEIPKTYTLSLREIGGNDIPSEISIYPLDFDRKYLVTDYLDLWNSDETLP